MESTVETMKRSSVTSPKYDYCIHTAHFLACKERKVYGRNGEMIEKDH